MNENIKIRFIHHQPDIIQSLRVQTKFSIFPFINERKHLQLQARLVHFSGFSGRMENR